MSNSHIGLLRGHTVKPLIFLINRTFCKYPLSICSCLPYSVKGLSFTSYKVSVTTLCLFMHTVLCYRPGKYFLQSVCANSQSVPACFECSSVCLLWSCYCHFATDSSSQKHPYCTSPTRQSNCYGSREHCLH